MSGEERELRRLFRAARAEDDRVAPPFQQTWQRARRRVPSGGIPVRRGLGRLAAAAAAAALLLVAALLGTRSTTRPGPVDLEREIALASEISSWRGPTSGLQALADVRVFTAGLALTSIPVPDSTGFSLADDAGPEGAER